MIIDLDNRVRSSVPSVLHGSSSKGNFTGSLISPDLVLGSGHTVSGHSIKFNGTNATVVYKDSLLDIALYQLRNPITNIEPLAIKKPSQILLNLYNTAVGFSKDILGQSADSNEYTNIVFNQLQTKLDAIQGASGGPIIDYSNNIVGVISREVSMRNINVADSITDDIINAVNYFDSIEGPSIQHSINQVEDTLEIKRFLNVENYRHYYTTDETEIYDLQNDDRFIEERSTMLDTEGFDLYKLWNTKTESYFYTSDVTEYVYINKNLDHFENFYEDSFSVEENTLHRLYQPSTGYHHFTTDSNEAAYIEEHLGYVNEGFV